jgi:hypothetical protein
MSAPGKPKAHLNAANCLNALNHVNPQALVDPAGMLVHPRWRQ